MTMCVDSRVNIAFDIGCQKCNTDVIFSNTAVWIGIMLGIWNLFISSYVPPNCLLQSGVAHVTAQ